MFVRRFTVLRDSKARSADEARQSAAQRIDVGPEHAGTLHGNKFEISYGCQVFNLAPHRDTDAASFPNAISHWKYGAFYRLDYKQVGQRSAEISIVMCG